MFAPKPTTFSVDTRTHPAFFCVRTFSSYSTRIVSESETCSYAHISSLILPPMPVAYVHLVLSVRAQFTHIASSFRSYNEYPPTYAVTDEADRNKQNDVRVDVRNLTRTPSPTPSEAEALSPGKKKKGGFIRSLFNPETYKDRKEFSMYTR